MHQDHLRRCLESAADVRTLLAGWGVRDAERGRSDLVRLAEMLGISVNDIIRDRPLEEITRDISRVADTALEVALACGQRTVVKRFGEPYTQADQPARCVILAFGKLGGKELNYSSDIDLMFLF